MSIKDRAQFSDLVLQAIVTWPLPVELRSSMAAQQVCKLMVEFGFFCSCHEREIYGQLGCNQNKTSEYRISIIPE